MRLQFGDDCADDDGADCALSCTTINSKRSSCSAACSSDADCRRFAQAGDLECIQVARKEQLEQRDVSFAVAVVIAACVLSVLALGYCALLRDKGGKANKGFCAACLSLAAIAAAIVVVSHSTETASEQDPTNVHFGLGLENVNATHFPQRFCAPHSLLWVVGVSMALAGSVAITFGTQLQKLAFNRQERAWQETVVAMATAAERGEESTYDPPPRTPWFKLPLWWVGCLFLVIGAVSDFAAVGFAAQSLLAPLAAASLIINSIQAPCLLGEVPTLIDVVATLVICAGCTVSVVFAEHSTRTYSLDDMLVLLTRPLFCTYLLGLVVLMVHVGTMIRRAKRDVQEVRISTSQYLAADHKSLSDTHTVAEPAQAEDDAEQGGVYNRLSQSEQEEAAEDASYHTPDKEENGAEEIVPLDAIERSRLAGSNRYAVYYAVLAGQCGGLTMLFAKMLSEIVKTLVQIGGLGAGWLTIAFATLAALLAVCMIQQLRFLNEGFRLFDLLLIQPIYQASWITGTAINGMLFFQEYVYFNYTQWVMFPFGVLVTVVGVASLAARHSAQNPPPSPKRYGERPDSGDMSDKMNDNSTRSHAVAELQESFETRLENSDDAGSFGREAGGEHESERRRLIRASNRSPPATL